MNRRTVRFFAVSIISLMLVTLVHAAGPTEKRLIAIGQGQSYWICVTTPAGTDAKGVEQKIFSIRQRVDAVAGRWAEIARMPRDIVSAAVVGNRLAVLFADGEWRLFQPGGNPQGPAMPDGYLPVHFASDNNQLLAIAIRRPVEATTAPTTSITTQPQVEAAAARTVFRWDGSVWSHVTDLPSALTTDDLAIARINGTLYLAARQDNAIDLWSHADEWRKISSIEARDVVRFKVLPGAGGPMIASLQSDGKWTITTPGTTEPIKSFTPHQPSDVTVVGPTLRLVHLKDATIEQIAYDNYGQGDAFPMAVVGDVSVPGQNAQSWMHIIGLLLLTITMVLTFRQRPATREEVLKKAPFHVAPFGRRLAAGFIDAVPHFVGVGFMLESAQNAQQLGFAAASGMALAGYFVGLAIYLLHVTLAEAIWGRSIGKMLFGLRVLNYDGTRVSVERILLRNFLRLVDLLFYAPLLLIFLTPMRQRIGDLAAKTIVVQEREADEEATDPDSD